MPRKKVLKEDGKLNEVKKISDKSPVANVVENESNAKVDINSNIPKEIATKKAPSKTKNIQKTNNLNQNNDGLKLEPVKEVIEKNISIKQKARINDSKKAKAEKEKIAEETVKKVELPIEKLLEKIVDKVDLVVPKVEVDEVKIIDLTKVTPISNSTPSTNKKSKSKSSKKIVDNIKIEPAKDEIVTIKDEPIKIIEVPPTKEIVESVSTVPSKNALRKARIKEARKVKKLKLLKQIELEKSNLAEAKVLSKEPIGQVFVEERKISEIDTKKIESIKTEKSQSENNIPKAAETEVIEKKTKSKNKKPSKKTIQPIQKEQIPNEIDDNLKTVAVTKEVLPDLLIENAEIISDGDNEEQYIVIDLNKKLSINPAFNANKIIEVPTSEIENLIDSDDDIIPIETTPVTNEIAEKPRSKNYKKNQKRKLAIRKAKELEQINKAELLKAESAKLIEAPDKNVIQAIEPVVNQQTPQEIKPVTQQQNQKEIKLVVKQQTPQEIKPVTQQQNQKVIKPVVKQQAPQEIKQFVKQQSQQKIKQVTTNENQLDNSYSEIKNISKSDIGIDISENTAKYISKLEKDIIPVNMIESKDISAVKINVSAKPHKQNQILNLNEKKQIEKRRTSLKRLIPDHSIIPQNRLLTITEKNSSTINNAITKVDDFLRKELFIESGMKFILAVSGGVDSVVLLDIMAQLASKYFMTLYVSHFNHNLRGENSKKDEQFVKLLAESYKLNYYHSSGNVKQYSEKNSLSIEHSARTLRYNFYERTARTINADFVASAHNANDSAETFLINLMRGAGLTGLSGIPSKRQLVKNVLIVRPLINFKKVEIIEYAKERNLKWREDESNALMNYTRNKVRLDLLPKLMNDYNPSIIDTLNRTSRLIQAADTIVDDIVRKNLPNIVGDITTERFYLKIPTLQTFDEFIQGELIQASMQKYFRSQSLNLNTIDRIISLLNSHTGSIAEINNNYLVLRDRDYLIFSKKTVDIDINQRVNKTGEFKIGKFKLILKEVKRSEVKFTNDPRIEYLDWELLPNFLEVRNWQQGDTFQPLGMGTQKVSDYLTNIKMPLIDKPKVLVLTSKSEIIWLIGLRLSEVFKVTPETKRIISAEIKLINEQK